MSSTSAGLSAPDAERPKRLPALSPTVLAYLIGPIAFVAILFLMKFNLVASEPVWLWFAVFCAVPLASAGADRFYLHRPSHRRLHLRVAASAAAVTLVIYLSGWGPVLVMSFAFLALENISAFGVPGLGHHHRVEPDGHRRRPARHLAKLGALAAALVAGQRAGAAGRLRPLLRHPHGRVW
jgi:TM2 domain-containing membrane protein YozV